MNPRRRATFSPAVVISRAYSSDSDCLVVGPEARHVLYLYERPITRTDPAPNDEAPAEADLFAEAEDYGEIVATFSGTGEFTVWARESFGWVAVGSMQAGPHVESPPFPVRGRPVFIQCRSLVEEGTLRAAVIR